jgi:Zn-dependent peptidase ImmA (M78 family)/transcriptional regulator with XRE-family HTH domain
MATSRPRGLMAELDLITQRLRIAREDSGLTQQQVADWLQIRRPGVVEIETGKRAVKSDELAKLAQLYGRSLAWLSGSEPGPEDTLAAALFRAGDTETSLLRREAAHLARRCHLVHRAEAALGDVRKPVLPQYVDEDALSERGRAVDHGRAAAYQERNRLGLGLNSPLRDPWGIVESAGLHVFPLHLGKDRGIDGVFARLASGRACVGVNIDAWVFRQVFTVVHEYAHAVLDANVNGEFCSTAQGWQLDLRNRYANRELRANQFAAVFLVPREALLWYFETNGKLEQHRGFGPRCRTLTPVDVVKAQDHFGVSVEMLLWRLQNENLVGGSTRQNLSEQVQAVGVNVLARSLGFAWRERAQPIPRTFEIAIEAYRRGKMTLGALADVLGMNKEEASDHLSTLGVHQDFAEDDPLIGAA